MDLTSIPSSFGGLMFNPFKNAFNSTRSIPSDNLDQNQLVPTNQLNDQSNPPLFSPSTDNNHLKLVFNTIFDDLPKLKRLFGVYKVYNPVEMEGQKWISIVEAYLDHYYRNPNDFIEYFHLFVDKDFHKWCFELTGESKSDWSAFKKAFLEKVYKLEVDYQNLVSSDSADFLSKLKTMNPKDKQLLDEIQNQPMQTYFKHKVATINRVYPRSTMRDMIKQAIFQIKDSNLKSKFYKLRNAVDLKDIIVYAKYVDTNSGV